MIIKNIDSNFIYLIFIKKFETNVQFFYLTNDSSSIMIPNKNQNRKTNEPTDLI